MAARMPTGMVTATVNSTGPPPVMSTTVLTVVRAPFSGTTATTMLGVPVRLVTLTFTFCEVADPGGSVTSTALAEPSAIGVPATSVMSSRGIGEGNTTMRVP
jgi:hypothetical protein